MLVISRQAPRVSVINRMSRFLILVEFYRIVVGLLLALGRVPLFLFSGQVVGKLRRFGGYGFGSRRSLKMDVELLVKDRPKLAVLGYFKTQKMGHALGLFITAKAKTDDNLAIDDLATIVDGYLELYRTRDLLSTGSLWILQLFRDELPHGLPSPWVHRFVKEVLVFAYFFHIPSGHSPIQAGENWATIKLSKNDCRVIFSLAYLGKTCYFKLTVSYRATICRSPFMHSSGT